MASERGRAQTGGPARGPAAEWSADLCRPGLYGALEDPAGFSTSQKRGRKPKDLGRSATGGESPVGNRAAARWVLSVSTAGHEKPRGKLGRPRSKAKYILRPIVNEYREGKVKSPPARGVKEFLKPSAYRQPEPYARASFGSPENG